MARTTHVKRAQQRYATVPVIDPETGEPKRTPVMKKVKDYDTGEVTLKQKTTKKGKPVFMTVTKQDRSKPLPPENCDYCHQPIEIGTPYKHITPKSGPYGGRKRSRHESCPSWQVWDYSNSLSAQLARISHDFGQAVDSAEDPDDITTALGEAADSIKEIADQKREGADNIEEGFGHETSASEELRQVGEDLDNWADEVSQADVPDMVECENCDGGQATCDACDGSGEVDGETCEDCEGSGEVECIECDGQGNDIDGWRDEVRDSVTIVDESPV